MPAAEGILEILSVLYYQGVKALVTKITNISCMVIL